MGFKRSVVTILDANITTLIASIILFIFGSGPVKGFAVTLSIGLITTLFSAYFISRHLTSIIVLRNREKIFNMKKEYNYNFTKKFKMANLISIFFVLISLI